MKVRGSKSLSIDDFNGQEFIEHFYVQTSERKRYLLSQLTRNYYQYKRSEITLMESLEIVLKKLHDPTFIVDTKIIKSQNDKLKLHHEKVKNICEMTDKNFKQKNSKNKGRNSEEINKNIPELIQIIHSVTQNHRLQPYKQSNYLNSHELYLELDRLKNYIQKNQNPFAKKQNDIMPWKSSEIIDDYKSSISDDMQIQTDDDQKSEEVIKKETILSIQKNILQSYHEEIEEIKYDNFDSVSQIVQAIIEKKQNKQKNMIAQKIKKSFSLQEQSSLQEALESSSSLFEKLKNIKEKSEEEIVILNKRLNELSLSSLKEFYFCQSKILPFHLENKKYHQFILDHIEKHERRSIKELQLLYQYSEATKNLIHRLINGQRKLLMIIQLINGIVLGAYSEIGFEKGSNHNPGFIFSATNLQYFKQIDRFKNKPICMYDDYFLIYGNSDLRIKISEPKITSNYGFQASYVNGKNGLGKVDDLLGCGLTKQTQYKCYEFYRVVLS